MSADKTDEEASSICVGNSEVPLIKTDRRLSGRTLEQGVMVSKPPLRAPLASDCPTGISKKTPNLSETLLRAGLLQANGLNTMGQELRSQQGCSTGPVCESLDVSHKTGIGLGGRPEGQGVESGNG